MTAERTAKPPFDFGPGRTAWEGIYGAAAECIAAWLPSLPEGVRREAQSRVYEQLRETGPGPYDKATTEQILHVIGQKLGRKPLSAAV